jgi:hypothetical protein
MKELSFWEFLDFIEVDLEIADYKNRIKPSDYDDLETRYYDLFADIKDFISN